MNNSSKRRGARWAKTVLACALAAAFCPMAGSPAFAAEPQAFTVAQSPLFLSSPLPNVLFLLDNSNSFDERADGVPVGSNHNTSKSIIARTALRNIVANYQGQINLGLMTYKLSSLDTRNLTPALYDSSYDPSDYDPTYTDAMALANGWEAFPYTSWASTPYTGAYTTPMPCAAPYTCPWPGGQGQPYLYTGINWSDTAYKGERRNKMVQYRNFGNTNPWQQHPYDFLYYNLMQASYSGSFSGYHPPGGAYPPPPMYCYSTDTFSLHGAIAGAPGGIAGNHYNCRWTKGAPLAGYKPDMNHNANGTGSISGNETNYGFSNTGFNTTYGPTDSDQAQGFSTFGRAMADMGNTLAASLDIPAAPSYYQENAVGYGALKSGIAPLNSAKITALNNLLQCRIPTTWTGGGAYTPPANTSACASTGIINAGATPSPGALQSAKRYFQGALTSNENETGQSLSALNTTGSSTNNLPNSCGKNYVIFFTDGMPTHKPDGSMYATPAAALADTVAAAASLQSAGVLVYVIGFGNAVQQSGLDQIAAAGGTNSAFISSDAATLNATLSAVFSDVIVRSASAASVATNSAQFSVSTAIFQARFTSADWSGQLLKYQTDNTNGAVQNPPDWDAGQKLNNQDWSIGSSASDRRQIITAAAPSPVSVDTLTQPVGIPFAWPANISTPTASELRPWQTSALNRDQNNTLDNKGSQRVDWLRGSHGAEGSSASSLRARSISVLGDIANSYPLYIGPPSSGVAAGSAYYAFKTSYASRPAVIAAASNEGMVHLFDAATGKERFAYVPSNGYRSNISANGASRLSQPMRQDYKTSHVYIADGSPVSEDVFFGGNWHTVLSGGVGAGGPLVYALNITNTGNDSSQNDPALTEANAASLLLWEFTDKNYGVGTLDASGNPVGVVNGDPDLGYAFSKPLITQANNGKWVAIFGNGYNNTVADGSVSATGRAALYVVDISNGQLIRKISAPVGTTSIPNGLGSPRGLDENLDGKTDTVYAGDLYGNLWKFDLSNANPANWGIAYSGNPLFTVTDVGSAGNRRPITGELRVTPNPSGGYMILFGTGRYLATPSTDLPASYDAGTVDALYSIWDNGNRITNGRSWLNGQSLQNTTSSGGVSYRQLTNNATTTCSYGNTPSSQPGCTMGCYVDLTGYPSAGANGERFTFFPQLSSGSASFNTIVPSANVCSAGGDSEQVIFNYLTCSSDTFSPFDVNNDNSFTSADLLSFGGSATLSPAGSKILSGITPPGTRVYNNSNGQVYVYNSSSLGGQPTRDLLRFNGKGGRVSWRPLPKNPKH